MSRPLRIALDVRCLQTPSRFFGIGTYARCLTEAMLRAESGHRYILLYAAGFPRPPLSVAPGAAVEWIPLPSWPVLRQLHWWVDQWMYPSAIRGLRPDVVFQPSPFETLVGYTVPTAPPTVATVHDLMGLRFPGVIFTGWRRWLEGMYRRQAALLTRASHLIADSAATARDVEALLEIPPSRMSVIPLGVEPAFAPPSPDQVAALRRRAGLPAKYLLFIGNVRFHRNLPAAVETLRALRGAGREDLHLVVAGDPKARKQVSGITNGTDLARQVVVVDHLDRKDVPALYAGAIALLFPSTYEGFGLPILEAMACGTPVVASNRTSVPEVAGEACQLVDPEDVPGMASAVERLLADAALRERYVAAGLARAGEFTWERTARATLAVLEAAASSQRPAQ